MSVIFSGTIVKVNGLVSWPWLAEIRTPVLFLSLKELLPVRMVRQAGAHLAVVQIQQRQCLAWGGAPGWGKKEGWE